MEFRSKPETLTYRRREGFLVRPKSPAAAFRGTAPGALYQFERPLRQERSLPPFGFLVLLLVTSRTEQETEQIADRLARLLLERAIPPLSVEGPAPAPLYRLKGRYRWQLLAKGPEPETLRRWVRDTLAQLPSSERMKVQVDVDPVDLC